MQKLLIAGSSGQAKITIDIIERVGTHRIVGLLDASRPVGEETFGYPIVGTTQDVAACAAKLGADSVFVAIGDNSVRKRVVEEIRAAAPDLDFPSVIHPSACIGRDVNVGPGVFMSAGVIINSAVEVAEGSLISANASLDHDSSIGAFASISPGACTGGGCTIGELAVVGVGASVIHGITIGDATVIGAGSTVVRDIPANCVAFGSPAKVVRSREPAEKYL